MAGRYAEGFELVGPYEGRNVYLWAPEASAGDVSRAWLVARGLAEGITILGYHERPSQREKARLIDTGVEGIIDLGTALHTCANYLITTERPTTYRDAVLSFLRRGGVYHCFLMQPDSEDARRVAKERGEDLDQKIQTSIRDFERFKRQHGELADQLMVYMLPHYPGMAALAVDIESPTGLILYSPYLPTLPSQKTTIERGDMPHYLASRIAGPFFDSISQVVRAFTSSPDVTRIM